MDKKGSLVPKHLLRKCLGDVEKGTQVWESTNVWKNQAVKVSHAGGSFAPFAPLCPPFAPLCSLRPLCSLHSPSPPLFFFAPFTLPPPLRFPLPPLLPSLPFAPFAPFAVDMSAEGVAEGAMECLQKGSQKGLAADMSFVVARSEGEWGVKGVRGSKGVILGFRVPTTSVGARGEGEQGLRGAKGSEGMYTRF